MLTKQIIVQIDLASAHSDKTLCFPPNIGEMMSRVKSGKFGHQVNSDTHLQTVYIQM